MREWNRDVGVLRVEVPDSVVPEPLRRGLEALAAGVAGDLSIPVPTIRYFQSARLSTRDDMGEARRFLETAGPRCLVTSDYQPPAWLDVVPAVLAGMGGFARPADPFTIWVSADGEATDMAEVVRHETRHLYQFWLRAALEGVMTTHLQDDAETRDSYEDDAEDYARATSDPYAPDHDQPDAWVVSEALRQAWEQWHALAHERAVSEPIRRAWEQWHMLVQPLYTRDADGYTTQTTYPTPHGIDWLWAMAYSSAGA